MRLLHTSDWHLGHALHGFSRDHEHERFLSWLLDTIGETAVDALLVAGDIFDSTNPPASAQRMLYQFLATLRGRHPDVQVVLIGGNHDSAGRLDAPGSMLEVMGVRVVGGLPRDAEGRLDAERLLIELRGRDGQRAWCVAIPHLRAADLGVPVGSDESPGKAVADLYEEAFALARARRRPGEALITTGHLYVQGAQVTELSERKVYLGDLHATHVDIFPADAAYVALGHLHLAQKVAGLEHVRYSGSPFPLSVTEAAYRHQIYLVDIRDGVLGSIESIPIPRPVEVMRLPSQGDAELDGILELVAALPAREGPVDAPDRPYLHVCVRLAAPVPDLARRLELALADRNPRLVRTTVTWTASADSLADSGPGAGRALEELDPEEVFRLLYESRHQEAPPEALMALYRELVVKVGEEGAA